MIIFIACFIQTIIVCPAHVAYILDILILFQEGLSPGAVISVLFVELFNYLRFTCSSKLLKLGTTRMAVQCEKVKSQWSLDHRKPLLAGPGLARIQSS